MEDSVKQRSTLRLNNSWTLIISLIALILSVVSIWMIQETSFSIAELNTTVSTPLQQQAQELARLKHSLSDLKTSQANLKAQYQAELNKLLKTSVHGPSNITTVQALPTIDTQALYLQLATLDSQLATLPLGKVLQTTTVSPQKIPAQTRPTWRDRLHDSWESFKSLIVIRHDDQATPELLSTNQKTNLLQNMHLLIVQTQLALLLHDDAIYHHNLAQLIQCLNRYVDVSDQQTKTFIQSLQALDKINIHPTMPNLAENR